MLSATTSRHLNYFNVHRHAPLVEILHSFACLGLGRKEKETPNLFVSAEPWSPIVLVPAPCLLGHILKCQRKQRKIILIMVMFDNWAFKTLNFSYFVQLKS